jgi:tetratricopeptide (TPR) repeat protein
LKKEHLAFLLGGFAFGIVVGFGLFNAIQKAPLAEGGAVAAAGPSAPAGPMAPTQVGGGGDAPMVAEINVLKQRLQDDPNDFDTVKQLANMYHQVQMWGQAAEFYERAVALRPEDPDLLTDLGMCLRGTGEFDRALESFAEANRIAPSHWESLFNTVIVSGFDLGQWDQAFEALELMEQMDPQPPRVGELRHAIEQARSESES